MLARFEVVLDVKRIEEPLDQPGPTAVRASVLDAVTNALRAAEAHGFEHKESGTLALTLIAVRNNGWSIAEDGTEEIVVRYSGGEEPTVTVPPGLDVEVKLVDEDEVSALILDYDGVQVFWTLRDDDMLSDNWCATAVRTASHAPEAFDLRDLLPPTPSRTSRYVAPSVRSAAESMVCSTRAG